MKKYIEPHWMCGRCGSTMRYEQSSLHLSGCRVDSKSLVTHDEMSKHTPGPWLVCGPLKTGFSSEYYRVVTLEKSVCQTSGDFEIKIPNNLEEQRCNASLISAAPEMLESLKLLLNKTTEGVRMAGRWPEHIEKAFEAIAKAEGKV